MPIIFSLVVVSFLSMAMWMFVEGYARKRMRAYLAARARTGVRLSLYAGMFFICIEFVFLAHGFIHPLVHSGGGY